MLGLPFHHVGIACADVDAAAEYVTRAYDVVSDTGTVHDPLQNAYVRLFNAGTPGAIELVGGPVVAGLLARKTSYYHVCYTSPDLEATLSAAAAAGAMCVSPPQPAVLFGGRRVTFVYTPLGLVEFVEERVAPPAAQT
jgi:methylmalonyl-CoA/ethylmalonyl-CoA epimerase